MLYSDAGAVVLDLEDLRVVRDLTSSSDDELEELEEDSWSTSTKCDSERRVGAAEGGGGSEGARDGARDDLRSLLTVLVSCTLGGLGIGSGGGGGL